MKNNSIAILLLCLFSQTSLGQAVYGVFTPIPNVGEKQIGTVSPANGDISLLGSNATIEDGRIDMTTGATALNVTDNKSYFIGEDNSDDPILVDRIYTVDLITGITDASPVLTAGYTTSTNFGIWYDDIDDVLYGLFLIGGTTAELATINPTTGAVTTLIADIVGDDVESFASGLMTGGRDNTNGSDAKRIFAFINDSVFAIDLDNTTSVMIEVGGANFLSSKTFGLEWDNINNALWVLYNPDLGERNLAKVLSEDDFTSEAFVDSEFGVDGTDPITTSSGLSALDEQSGLFFFIGRPSVGANTNKWSLYTVDVNAQTSSNVDIEDTAQVQTNGYAGIEVLPGPDMTFSKSDGDISAVPSDVITYVLNYSNDNNAGATNGLTLTETVPAETTFNATASTAGWNCLPDNTAGSSCEISLADIGPGGSGNVNFAVTVDAMVSVGLTEISNSATLSAINIVTNYVAADTTPITATAVLAVTKTDNDLSSAVPGDTIAYDITASNVGNRVASNAVLTETVPEHTTYIPTLPYNWTCLPNNNAGSSCTTTAVDLAGSGFATQFHTQIIASVPAGTTQINNEVILSADNAFSAVTFDFTPITSSAVLTLTKTDGDTVVVPGNSVVYQIDYGNSGDQDADSVVLTEMVLNGTQFDAGLSSAGWLCTPDITAGSSCSLDLNTVTGGTASSVDFALLLESPVQAIYSQLSNTVTMDASNAAQVMAQDDTPIDAAVNLRIVKTDGEVTAALGKVINYTLINFNDGNRDAIQVELTETVPEHTTFYPPSSTMGWSCVPDNSAGSTCTFDIAELDGDGGKTTAFFAVKVDSSLDPGVTELSNTASISAFNATSTAEDTELTPIDKVIPMVTLIDANPSITEIASCSQNDAQINEVIVSFQDDNPGLIGVNNINNYALIDTGLDQDLQSNSCAVAAGDDVLININSLTVGGTATDPNATLTLDDNLAAGQYVLLICDDITDAAGNAIDGDQNGLPGGNLNRQFRVEFDNLFSNAYLDDCTDSPITLNPWLNINDVGDMVNVTTAEDTDDSSLSGAVFMDSLAGATTAIEQCVSFSAVKSHAVVSQVLGSATQVGDLLLTLSCDFSDLPACGNVIGSHNESFTLTASVTPNWKAYESIMLLPENSLSASCSVAINSPDNQAFTNYVDALKLRDAEVIYIDGFEAD